MRVARPILTAAMLCLAAACSEEYDRSVFALARLAPEAEPLADALHAPELDITVMTRNMYVGAEVDAVIGALVTPDPADDQVSV